VVAVSLFSFVSSSTLGMPYRAQIFPGRLRRSSNLIRREISGTRHYPP